MSYADASLDLSSVSVACLAGHNGAGKSALLDAITWALWERARSSSDELVRLGEREMWIDMTFEYESRIYRVRRSRLKRASKSGKTASKGTLDFQVLAPLSEAFESGHLSADVAERAEGESEGQRPPRAVALLQSSGNPAITSHPSLAESTPGHWRSLTGSSMRDTQQVICELLRMDYDTFVNSAYLRQGRADEFTTRLPSERKHLLSEILGLSYFDRIVESCRIKSRESKLRIEELERNLLGEAQTETALRELIDELSQTRFAYATASARHKELKEKFDKLNEQMHELKGKRDAAAGWGKQVDELEVEMSEVRSQEKEFADKVEELDELIEKSSDIREKAARFAQVKELAESLDQRAFIAQGKIEEKMKMQGELAKTRSRLETELEHARQLLQTLDEKIGNLEGDTAGRDKIEEQYKEFKELILEEGRLAQKQDAFTRLNERANQLQSIIAESRIKLDAEIDQKEIMLHDLDGIIAGADLLVEKRKALEAESERLDRLESEFELVEDRGLSLKTEIEAIDLKVEEIKRRQKELAEKIRELKEHDHSTVCPLCSGPIVDRAAVIDRYSGEIDSLAEEMNALHAKKDDLEFERVELRRKYLDLKHQLDGRKELDKQIGQFNEKEQSVGRARDTRDSVSKELANLKSRMELHEFSQVERESLINVKAEIHKLEFEPALYTNLQSQIRSKRHIEAKHQQLKKDLVELEKLATELPSLKAKAQILSETLSAESYGEELREAIKVLQKDLDELGYDREEHNRRRIELAELMPFSERLTELSRASDSRPQFVEKLEKLRRSLAIKTQNLLELKQKLDDYNREAALLPASRAELALANTASADADTEARNLHLKLTVDENKRKGLESKLEEYAEMHKQLEQRKEELEDYAFLSEAFGKKGIQAIIIENAVPEIESEANRILSRLSDNKMHVALVTQQRTKAGTISETLDIVIGDDVGTRDYELYSGGEAFKINFALRIALSRLLARRAGARLETLIIDEGFGSQDDESREKLVRAIRSVQSDFAKILVITHISDIREMFPVQIQATKRGGVSTLQVV
jgi:ATPase involved in DNA repair